jgi:hypothetical protein
VCTVGQCGAADHGYAFTVMRFQPPPSVPRVECLECPTCHADDAMLAYAPPRRRVFSCPRCQSLWQALTQTSPSDRGHAGGVHAGGGACDRPWSGDVRQWSPHDSW